MMRFIVLLAACAAALPLFHAPASGQARPDRSVPQAVRPPPEFTAAVGEGTRTSTGRPGAAYWQNWTDYRLLARVFPDAKRVEGTATIRYHNRSPGPLRGLALDLLQNFHAPASPRLEVAEVTGGVTLGRVQVDGATISADAGAGARYQVQGTKMLVYLQQPLAAGASVDLAIDWSFTIPRAGISGRMGHNDENLIYLAYFYPQVSVYDDVVGWHLDPFLGSAEFYSGFGSYQVTIEAPPGWLVMGTGTLTNPEQVLSAPVLARLRQAEQSDQVVQVVGPADVANATRPAEGGVLSWTFRADSVRDVAYSLTRASVWDAARSSVGDRDGDGRADYTRVDAVYRPAARRWTSVARYAQHSIRFLSEHTGFAYPWPHMTAVEGSGIIGGGMEYPMMTLIGNYTAAGDSALYAVTVHELAHMWIPMMVSIDERRYSWFDEGTTTYNENQARKDFYPGVSNPAWADRDGYLEVAQAGQEGEMMRRSDYHYPGPAYVVASYYKPAVVLEALKGVLGDEVFNRAYREFFDRWAFKHAYPWDFWNTFEDVSGRDLDWFWRSWYHETWLLDQAVERVTDTPQGSTIVVSDRGDVPMPVLLSVRLANGETVRREIPVDGWLTGSRTASIVVPGQVTRVEIDADQRFPDADRANNVWTR